MFDSQNFLTKEANAAFNYIAKSRNFTKQQTFDFIITEALLIQIKQEKDAYFCVDLNPKELKLAYAKTVFVTIKYQKEWRNSLRDCTGISNSLYMKFVEQMKADKILYTPTVRHLKMKDSNKKMLISPIERPKVIIPEQNCLKFWYLVMTNYKKKFI